MDDDTQLPQTDEPAVTEAPAADAPAAEAAPVTSMAEEITKGLEAQAEAKPAESEAKPAADAKPPVAAKDDLTPPPGLSAGANKRFQALAGMVREKDAEIQRITAEQGKHAEAAEIVKGYSQVFDDAKCKPEQFEMAIDFIKAVNTGNADRAMQIIGEQVKALQLRTGKDFAVPDALSPFQDLTQATQNGEITRQHALELARARASEQERQQAEQQTRQAQQTEAQGQQAVMSGAQAVAAWTAQVAKTDFDWPAKEKLLDGKIDWLAANAPPSQWLTHLQNYYDMLSASSTSGKPAPTPQPLRANGGESGAQAQPRNAAEAISQGLGYAGA